MAIPRSEIVDLDLTKLYHCISRCCRHAHLMGEGYEHRKTWVEERMEFLTEVFAVGIAGYAVLDNHIHTVVRLEGLEMAKTWSQQEVARRWAKLYPPRNKKRKPLADIQPWIKEKVKDKEWIEKTRKRLANLGWFMKCLKEPLARQANEEDGVTGAFFEGRYKSIALLDRESILAVMAYVDLNIVAAGIADLPEDSDHTSIVKRLENCCGKGQTPTLREALEQVSIGCLPSADQSGSLESGSWLCPLDTRNQSIHGHPGILDGFSLPQYLLLLDCTSRIDRPGKCQVAPSVPPILERLSINSDAWDATIRQLAKHERPLGVTLSFSRQRLRDAAVRRSRHHVANLNGCPA